MDEYTKIAIKNWFRDSHGESMNVDMVVNGEHKGTKDFNSLEEIIEAEDYGLVMYCPI